MLATVCYAGDMAEANEAAQENEVEQMPFSAAEWAQTPPAVQEFVLTLVARVQALEAEVADLREQVNRNSHNSSQPPSSDGPQVPSKLHWQAKSGRKRGGQKGHPGHRRELVPVEQVRVCRQYSVTSATTTGISVTWWR